MRPLEFRIRNKKIKFMYEPVDIFLFQSGFDFRDAEDGICIDQFIGLQDRNGKEIYENDILKTIPYHNEESELVVVEFTKFNKCGGCPYQTHGIGFNVGEYELDHLEIIGNIHQNPELLGEQK